MTEHPAEMRKLPPDKVREGRSLLRRMVLAYREQLKRQEQRQKQDALCDSARYDELYSAAVKAMEDG